jgi:hypothetical protein
MSALETIQTVLDTLLYTDNVHVYWQRRTKSAGRDPDEYVVYTLDGDPASAYADDKPLIREANIAVRYYYRESLTETVAGRAKIESRAQSIVAALEAADFSVPQGAFDAGDIDDIGFCTKIIECYFGRVV